MRRNYLAIGALALVGLLAIAGCGGSGGSSSSATTTGETAGAETAGSEAGGGASESTSQNASQKTPATATASATPVATVKVMQTPKLGKVIVASNGMTIYDFHKDKGTTSSCYGACAQVWPPLLTGGKPKAAGGAEASLLGTTKRKDGTLQVTYKGHPMYFYVSDRRPGDTTGNDIDSFGAEWYALEPNGEEPEDG